MLSPEQPAQEFAHSEVPGVSQEYVEAAKRGIVVQHLDPTTGEPVPSEWVLGDNGARLHELDDEQLVGIGKIEQNAYLNRATTPQQPEVFETTRLDRNRSWSQTGFVATRGAMQAPRQLGGQQ